MTAIDGIAGQKEAEAPIAIAVGLEHEPGAIDHSEVRPLLDIDGIRDREDHHQALTWDVCIDLRLPLADNPDGDGRALSMVGGPGQLPGGVLGKQGLQVKEALL